MRLSLRRGLTVGAGIIAAGTLVVACAGTPQVTPFAAPLPGPRILIFQPPPLSVPMVAPTLKTTADTPAQAPTQATTQDTVQPAVHRGGCPMMDGQ
jgi:hypothetical protein